MSERLTSIISADTVEMLLWTLFVKNNALFGSTTVRRPAGLPELMDVGHYHPSELISDKISSMLLYLPKRFGRCVQNVWWCSRME